MAKRGSKKQEEQSVEAQETQVETAAQEEQQAEETQQEVQAEAKEESRLKQDLVEALKPYKHQLQTPDGASTVRTIVRNLAQQECNVTISKQNKITIDLADGQRIEL